jgi:hypothetical protein
MNRYSMSRPATIAQAVDYLVGVLPLRDKACIARMKEEELIELRLSSLGLYIRSEFGLWAENKKLMRDCCAFAGNNALHGESASAIIIHELWLRLRETHRLRLVS